MDAADDSVASETGFAQVYVLLAWEEGEAPRKLVGVWALQARKIAPLWPAYHLGQLALSAVGQPSEGATLAQVAALAAVTIVFLAVARRRLARA